MHTGDVPPVDMTNDLSQTWRWPQQGVMFPKHLFSEQLGGVICSSDDPYCRHTWSRLTKTKKMNDGASCCYTYPLAKVSSQQVSPVTKDNFNQERIYKTEVLLRQGTNQFRVLTQPHDRLLPHRNVGIVNISVREAMLTRLLAGQPRSHKTLELLSFERHPRAV